MPYERDIITKLHAYVPGEQPTSTEVVKLNTNENPYPPPQAVMDAVHAIDGESLRRYPSPTAQPFRQAAAEAHRLSPEQVIATNGGDELLRMLITVYCEPGAAGRAGEAERSEVARGGIGVAEPSYSLYPVLAAIHDTSVTRVPLGDRFALSEDIADAWNSAGCRLGFVVNPHAPSGRWETPELLGRIADRFDGVLVIDEAYVDFAKNDSLSLVRQGEAARDNVVVLRTLSKGYSLAGMRFGYGLAGAGIIAALDKVRDSYNTDAVSQRAAVAAIQSREVAADSWQKVIAERNRLIDELSQRGLSVLPSASNFLLASLPSEGEPDSVGPLPQAAAVYQSLKQRLVFVRYFDQDRLRDSLRITVGTPAQNDRLLEALDEIAATTPQA